MTQDTSREAVERLIAEIPGVKDSAQDVWGLQARTFATLRALIEERDERASTASKLDSAAQRYRTRAEAAEARVVELEGALRELRKACGPIVANCFYDNGDVTIGMPQLRLPAIETLFWKARKADRVLSKGTNNAG